MKHKDITNHIDIYIDGKKADGDRLSSSLPSEEYMAVYESLKSYQGVVFRLPQHLKRLAESAKTAGLAFPKTLNQLGNEVKKCVSAYRGQDRFLRLTVDARHSYLFVTERKRPASIYEKGVALKTSAVRRNHINASSPSAKTGCFINNVMAVLDGLSDEPFDSILLDSKGYVTEGTIWNIFLVKDGTLYTPGSGILVGVTRQCVIECAQQEAIPVRETFLTRHDFWNSDEAMITNTSGEIVPVRSLDGRRIGTAIPGRVTQILMRRFKQELNKKLKEKT